MSLVDDSLINTIKHAYVYMHVLGGEKTAFDLYFEYHKEKRGFKRKI